MEITSNLRLLGFKVRDLVTEFEGVCESINFDLYGCIQAVVRAAKDPNKPSELADGRWFDIKRLVPISDRPVMDIPTFDYVPGGSEKSMPPTQPVR